MRKLIREHFDIVRKSVLEDARAGGASPREMAMLESGIAIAEIACDALQRIADGIEAHAPTRPSDPGGAIEHLQV